MLVTAWILLICSIIMMGIMLNSVNPLEGIYLDPWVLTVWMIIFALSCGVIFGHLFRPYILLR